MMSMLKVVSYKVLVDGSKYGIISGPRESQLVNWRNGMSGVK